MKGSPTKSIDPKLGAPRKTAGVRNLPKIDKKANGKISKTKKNSENGEKDIKPAPLGPLGSRKTSAQSNDQQLESLTEAAKEE